MGFFFMKTKTGDIFLWKIKLGIFFMKNKTWDYFWNIYLEMRLGIITTKFKNKINNIFIFLVTRWFQICILHHHKNYPSKILRYQLLVLASLRRAGPVPRGGPCAPLSPRTKYLEWACAQMTGIQVSRLLDIMVK